MLKKINSNKAPKAIGAYSQAIVVNGFLYTSGQIPLVPKTGEIVSGGIEEQTRQVMDNLKSILLEAGLDFKNIIKTTIYIKDMNEFSKINSIYSQYFYEPFPARSCVEVARLPKDVLIEIEAIAYV
jgi:2-iminobutanoate/2-iminopropanoate deaminase